MTEQEITIRILTFARHMGSDGSDDAKSEARRRKWLDEQGRPTDEGRELLHALDDQRTTRTVFRGVA